MAIYDNLPVYRVAYDLLRLCYRLSVAMDRAYRFTLGERLHKEMGNVLLNVYRANCVREKTAHIRAARENAEMVRLLMRVAHDEGQIVPKKFIAAAQQIESISKQLAAWEKSQPNTDVVSCCK